MFTIFIIFCIAVLVADVITYQEERHIDNHE